MYFLHLQHCTGLFLLVKNLVHVQNSILYWMESIPNRSQGKRHNNYSFKLGFLFLFRNNSVHLITALTLGMNFCPFSF